MASIALVFRVLLAAVFAFAGVAKLRDRRAFHETVVAFGVPLRLAGRVAQALPIVEFAVAAALLVEPAGRWGGLAAALLLCAFIAGIGHALSQGLTPDCNCFGQLTSEQIGPRTVARNGALLAIALVVVWQGPGSSLNAWTSNTQAGDLVGGLTIVALLLVTALALDYRRRLREAPVAAPVHPQGEALPIGEPAPRFELSDLEGAPVPLEALCARRLPIVLVFASPTCAPCEALMPELVRWASALDERLTLVVVESGVPEPDMISGLLPELGELRVLTESEREVANSFGVLGTPTGIALDSDGKIVSQLALGSVGIEALIRSVVRQGPVSSSSSPMASQPA